MTAGWGFARASKWAAAFLFAAGLTFAPQARAETLAEVLPELLKVSKKIKAAEADMAAANEKAREALGDWFPKLDLTGNYGYERQFKGNATADTSAPPREFEMKITQLLWDFGSTNRAIDNARLTYEQARAARDATEQAVILEGIIAYLDLMRRTKILEFSRGSEDNIKRQTELEDARVQRGSGFSTDVLQSKRQLANAQATRVRAEGALQSARNRYLNVFDKLPEKPATMAMPRLPLNLLPQSLNEVVDISGRENPQLKAAKMTTEIARNNVSKTLSDKFAPTINLVGEHAHKNDFDGTLGTKNERMVKVEGKYSFNLGLTAINTLKASEFTLTSAENKYGETLDNVQEQARNAWQELDTQKQNLEHLRNEANIAAEFLELARKERALGRRSLIDVLQGETSLIEASSNAASAETDMAISVFKLLTSMGRLELGAVVPPAAPPRSETDEQAPKAESSPAPASEAPTEAAPGPLSERLSPAPAPASENASAAASEPAPPAFKSGADSNGVQPAGETAAVPLETSSAADTTMPAAAWVDPDRDQSASSNAPVADQATQPPVSVPAEQVASPPAEATENVEAPLLVTAAGWTQIPTAASGGKEAASAEKRVDTPAVSDSLVPTSPALGNEPVLYMVRKANLRSGTSFTSPPVRALDRCAAVVYVQGRDDWFLVRAPASGPEGAAEGWVYGHLVSKNRAACEPKRAGY